MSPQEAASAIDSVFTDWFPHLVRYAYRATGDFGLAEDIAQTAFLALYRAWVRGDEIEYPKAWLLCVVRREVIRHAERDWQGEALDEDHGAQAVSHAEAPYALEFDELLKQFGVLTRREEEVLILRLQSLKYHEIAAHLGLSIPSVGTLLARAVKKLKKVIAAPESLEAPQAKRGRSDHAARRLQ